MKKSDYVKMSKLEEKTQPEAKKFALPNETYIKQCLQEAIDEEQRELALINGGANAEPISDEEFFDIALKGSKLITKEDMDKIRNL